MDERIGEGTAKEMQAAPPDDTSKFKKWYYEAEEYFRQWRVDATEDVGFYHGGLRQWKKADAAQLESEDRPVLSLNRVKPTIDLQKGIEIRSRADIDAKPRGASDGKTADAITAGFKYIQDTNKADHIISDVFFDGISAGIGWIEVGENPDPRQEEVLIAYADWKNVGWDPHARHMLLDDCRYRYYRRWMDLDVAKATWPDKADNIQTAYDENPKGTPHVTVQGDQYASPFVAYYDKARAQVLVVQMWFKKSEPAIFLKMKDGNVKEVTEEWLQQNSMIVSDPSVHKIVKRQIDRMYSVKYNADTILEPATRVSTYHDFYPLVPFICYIDDEGKPYGMIRNMKDPQREINGSRSQYSHILRTRRVFFETGAIKNPLEAKKSISRPDAWIELNSGALAQKRFQFQQDLALAREFFEIMREAKQELQEVGGSVQEQMGQETNARSGVAIEARSRQGATVNTEPFDNIRLSKSRMGELMLAEMKRLWTYEKVIRITEDTTGADKFVTFNAGNENVINQGRYDIVVSEHPESETTRNWASRTMMEFATRMPPDIALPVLEASFEMADIPNKDKVLEKLAQAREKQDQLTQQGLINDAMGKIKPPTASPAAPEEGPGAMGPPQPGISAEGVLKKIMAGETWGAVKEIKDTTAEKAAEFVKAPKSPPAGASAGSPSQAKKGRK